MIVWYKLTNPCGWYDHVIHIDQSQWPFPVNTYTLRNMDNEKCTDLTDNYVP